MLAEERRLRLTRWIRERRFASIPELVEILGVSESTVRRDLELLEEEGATKRTHGGVFYAGDAPGLPHFDGSGKACWQEKQAIAAKAVERVQEGDSVLLGGGSTVYEVARRLLGRRLHVVTTSLPIANLFATDPQCDLILIGGNICPRSGVARGPLADRMLESLRVRRAILSVAGVSEDGFFNNNLLLVETEQRMMAVADDVTVVADHAKWGHGSLAHLCPLSGVQCVVVDSRLDPVWIARMHAAGVEVWVA